MRIRYYVFDNHLIRYNMETKYTDMWDPEVNKCWIPFMHSLEHIEDNSNMVRHTEAAAKCCFPKAFETT